MSSKVMVLWLGRNLGGESLWSGGLLWVLLGGGHGLYVWWVVNSNWIKSFY